MRTFAHFRNLHWENNIDTLTLNKLNKKLRAVKAMGTTLSVLKQPRVVNEYADQVWPSLT